MTAGVPEFEAEDIVDWFAVLARLKARRWWVFASTVLFAALFTAGALLMTPVYRATVVLAPASASGDRLGSMLGNSALGALLPGMGSQGNPETEEALAVLQSREFTETFIEKQRLMPRLFAKLWDPRTGTWRADVEKPPTAAKAFKRFDLLRTVSRDRKTGLITLQFEWTDRVEAAAWANALVRELNDAMRARTKVKADAALEYLERELQSESTVEVRAAVGHLIESEVKQRMLADVTPDYAFRVVDSAMPLEADEPIRPKKGMLVAIGVGLGLAVGIVTALLRDSWRSRRLEIDGNKSQV